MEDQNLTLREMLQIARRVDNWNWLNRPKFYPVEIGLTGIDLHSPKKIYEFTGEVEGIELYVATGREFYTFHPVDLLQAYANGFELGTAAFLRKKNERLYIGRGSGEEMHDVDGHKGLLEVLETAKNTYHSQERKRAREILDSARRLIKE